MRKDKVFELERRVTATEIDALDHVNNVVYLQWIQEIANAHWFQLSTPEQRDDIAWVVIRHEIDYHKSARLNDVVTIRTWVGKTEGFRSVRHVEILNAEGAKILSSSTTYCLIDPKSFRPMKMTKEIRDSLTNYS